jgi:[CysO sulfur-carrier protein]-S-L-cysteine hydrolase
MSTEPLYLPRRLAIRLLSDAQRAGDGEVRGIVLARGGQPVSLMPGGDSDRPQMPDETVWATYRSHPAVNWRPQPADIDATGHPQLPHLVMSLDTKGVLQLRGWVLDAGQVAERELKVRD